MTKIRKIIPVFLLAIGIVISCSKDEESSPESVVELPTEAKLLFPRNNKECNEGTVISETETEVLFKWEEATVASSYELQITDLSTGASRAIKTISTEVLIRVLRGTAYSWYVKSEVGGTNEKTDSEIWRFYNAGLPVQSYPPFPAEATNPKSGASVEAGTISLKWETSDIDNDITSFKILFDTVSPPEAEVGTTSVNNFNIEANSGEVYYWKVISVDSAGNESNSQIFQFKVN